VAPFNRALRGAAIALAAGLRHSPAVRESLRRDVWGLPAMPVAGGFASLLGVVILSLMFLTVAFWNGFPLVFYDSGAYVLEGLGHIFLVERAPVYAELLFVAGGSFSLWPIVAVQAVITSYVILETARCEVPHLTLAGLAGIGAALTLFTGIAWYVGQVEPDCFTPLVILGSWLLLFRAERLDKARTRWMTGITALAVACHPSHLGLIAGLVLAAALLAVAARRLSWLPRPRLKQGLAGLAAGIGLIVAGNFALTGTIFLSKSGSVFVFARLMQDGIVQKLMADTCPPAGDTAWRLCAYRRKLPRNANAWLWGEQSAFRTLGGFTGRQQQEEDRRVILETLKRYPLLNVKMAAYDSLLQFLAFRTGDGIEPQEQILEPNFKRVIPAQMHAYLGARQQRGLLRFKTLNLIHVPVGAMSVLGLLLLLQHAGTGRRWSAGAFPALILLGLVGNAIICGTFSNPHDRYQSRVMWLPSLVLLLALARDRRALQPVPESGT
jgi:hypothetical protein